jgi:DNA-directed RNA polymerase specialized sigma24 family protein
MDVRTQPPPRSGHRTRPQKYLHFSFAEGDEALIERLPPAQQKVLKSPGTYEQRAQDLGVAIGTVRSRLHRARAALIRLREIEAQRVAPREATDSAPPP